MSSRPSSGCSQLEMRQSDVNTALLAALRDGDAELVRLSIQGGADVNLCCSDPFLSTPLHMAAALPSPACLIELLQGAERPTYQRNAEGESPLFIACRASHRISIPLLLLSTFGVTTDTNKKGDTFLHVLMSNTSMNPTQTLELTQWILTETDSSSQLNLMNTRGKTVYDVAREHQSENHSLLHLLVQHGAASAQVCYSSRQYGVLNGETMRRGVIYQNEQQEREQLAELFTYTITRARLLETSIADLSSAESTRRGSIATTEGDRWVQLCQKMAKRVERQRQKGVRQKRKKCALIQAVGRGYVARQSLSHAYQATADSSLCGRGRSNPGLHLLEAVLHLQRVGRGTICRKEMQAHQVSVLHTSAADPSSCPDEALRRSASTDSLLTAAAQPTPERRRRTEVYPSEGGASVVSTIASWAHPQQGVAAPDVLSGFSPPSSTIGTVRFADPSPAGDAALADGASRAHSIAPTAAVTTDAASKAPRSTVPPLTLEHVARSEDQSNMWLPERHKSVSYSETNAACCIQRFWQRYQNRRRAEAVHVIQEALAITSLRIHLFNYRLEKGIKGRIHTVTKLVTSLVWRENFCSEFRRITREKRYARRALAASDAVEPAARCPWYHRWGALTTACRQWTLLAQLGISLFLLIYMGCAPRSGDNNVHNKVDIAFCTVQLVLLLGFPASRWRLVDGAIIITALVCAACEAYGGTILITLLLLKVPLLISYFFPNHSATHTYCRALRYCGLYLLMLSPLGLACVGSTVRGTAKSALLLTSGGNWGRILLVLWSTLSPQYAVRTLVHKDNVSHEGNGSALAQLPPFYGARTVKQTVEVGGDWRLEIARLPTVQLLICNIGLLLFFHCAIIVGTHNAIREHYDLSDETKLKRNKRRFQYKHYKQKMELLDAHRAATIEALGQQLDGLMWEDDIRAAKEAIRESHKIQFQGVIPPAAVVTPANSKGNAPTKGMDQSAPWDCRNEDPQSRGRLDIAAIETALGKAERTGRRERFFIRQWKGSVFRRESTFVVVVFVIMSSIEPNLYAMEAAFSAVYTIELLLSLYFLRVEFIFSHPWRLLIRLFCAVIGFVPSGIPFVVLRGLRLLEGWSTLFDVPGMVKWGLMYCIITLCTIWMVSFVASLQFAAASAITMRDPPSYCTGAAHCLALSLRELVLPAWTPLRIDPVREPPVTCLLIIAFQFLFIPFMLSFLLHPLLQLSNFIGRFLRLVVRSLHKDVLGFLGNYVEGEEWFRRWALVVGIPTNVIVKLKLWVHDIQRPPVGFTPFSARTSAPLTHERSFFFRNETMVMPLGSDDSVVSQSGESEGDPAEIVSKTRFASLKDNAARRDVENHTKGELVALQPQTNSARAVVMAPRPKWQQQFERLTRRMWLHVANAVLTAASFAFLWVADASSSSRSAIAILASIIHAVSIASNVLVVPRDLTAILTCISSGALIVSIVIIHIDIDHLRPVYAVRFLSLLRLAQIQIYPFRAARSFLGEYMASWSKILFPFLLVGGLSYAAELLRAQIYMVRHPTFSKVNATNATASRTTSVESAGAFLVESEGNLTGNATSYPEWLASFPRQHNSRPNVNVTRSLFTFYFREDAYIFFSIFNFWLLPALAITTCLSYLYWSGSNLRDTDRSAIFLIPFLEDPITLASFRFSQSYFHYFANAVLLLSVTFGCIFSPSTQSVAKKDHNFFFGFEAGFTCVGLIDALLSVAFAVYRSRRTWAGRSISRQDFRYVHVLVGDTALVLAEVVQLLYYCVAFPITIAMLVDSDNLLLSPDDYALFFVTLRFAILLRLLPRQCLLTFTQAFPTVVFACAAIVIYYIASASALADTAGASSGGLTTGLWRAAFNDLLRASVTFAGPNTLSSQWTTPNETAIAQKMLDASLYRQVDTGQHASDEAVFILSTIGKAIVASAFGLGAAILLVPLRTPLVAPLPPKSAQLYRALSGGINAIVKEGETLHDDMRPDARRRLQKRKFTRMFTARGIPSWGLRHLLEELNIARPSRQRRFMFLLEQLLVYLPISDLRQEQVREYMSMWSCYCSGGPADLSFTVLAAYPPPSDATPAAAHGVSTPTQNSSNPLFPPGQYPGSPKRFVDTSHNQVRYIAPLRLVQALALFELNFPTDSSIGSQVLMDFFTVVQKVRGATLMQSLWRMYRAEQTFEADRSKSEVEKVKLTHLRRQFRKLRMKNDVAFRRSASVAGKSRTGSFSMALANDVEVYNLDTGHYDLLNRIRGHYHQLTVDATPSDEEAADQEY